MSHFFFLPLYSICGACRAYSYLILTFLVFLYGCTVNDNVLVNILQLTGSDFLPKLQALTVSFSISFQTHMLLFLCIYQD